VVFPFASVMEAPLGMGFTAYFVFGGTNGARLWALGPEKATAHVPLLDVNADLADQLHSSFLQSRLASHV